MPSQAAVRWLLTRSVSNLSRASRQQCSPVANGFLGVQTPFKIVHANASSHDHGHGREATKDEQRNYAAWTQPAPSAIKIDMRRANYDELSTPDGSWQAFYDIRQKRNNLMLAAGIVGLSAVGIYIWQKDPFHFEKALMPRKFMKNPPAFQTARVVNGKVYAPGEPVPDSEMAAAAAARAPPAASSSPPPPPPPSDTKKSEVKSDKKAQNQQQDKKSSTNAQHSTSSPPSDSKSSSIAGAVASAVGLNQLTSSSSSNKTTTEPNENSVLAEPNRENLPDIPSFAPYVIIGGGTASFAAFRAIRARDPTAKVLVISNEKYLPYMRPPLSKEMWFTEDAKVNQLKFTRWNGRDRSLLFEQDEFYVEPKTLQYQENGGVAIALGRKAIQIDAVEQKIVLDNGWEVQYDKLLIATGGRPKSLPVFDRAGAEVMQNVTLFRGIDDFNRLSDIVKAAKRIVIIGSGFLGSELACSLGRLGRENDVEVLQVYREAGNMAHVLPAYLSAWTTQRVQEEGVKALPSTTITSVKALDSSSKRSTVTDTPSDRDDDEAVTSNRSSSDKQHRLRLTMSDGSVIDADHVVVAVGIVPEANLARSSGLEVDPDIGGYRTNAELQARNNIWVAGDCSSFYDVRLGRRRVEHHDHAVVSGRLAGENMTGTGKPYYHQSMFWSDLGPELGYEAIGLVDSRLETYGVFARATSKDSPKALVEATGESLRSVTETEATSESASSSTSSSTWKSLLPEVLKSAMESPSDDDAQKVVDSSTLQSSSGDNNSSSSSASDKPRIESLYPEDFTDGKLDYGKGIVFYLRDRIIVGMVMWNVFNRMPIARKILKDERNSDEISEVAKLFQIHKEDVEY